MCLQETQGGHELHKSCLMRKKSVFEVEINSYVFEMSINENILILKYFINSRLVLGLSGYVIILLH